MIVNKEGLLGSALQCAFTDLLTSTDISSKLEALLSKATKATDSDGATVYLLDRTQHLRFFAIRNDTLNLSSEKDPELLTRLGTIPLYNTSGHVNTGSMAAFVVSEKKSIHVKDIYKSTDFLFEGAKNFDNLMGYKTKSILAVPLINNFQEVIGVLQLINRIDTESGKIISFADSDIYISELLADQVAVYIDNHNMKLQMNKLVHRIAKINEIGIALTSNDNLEQLLEHILTQAKELTGADGGTLYLHKEGKLIFEVMQTDSLGVHLSHAKGNLTKMKPLDIYSSDGHVNNHIVAANVAAHSKAINIPNIYENTEYNFSGVKKFDQENDYRTMSILTLPLVNQHRETVGVLQLINSIDETMNDVGEFSKVSQELAESLASFAAVAITNNQLNDDLEKLIEAFIATISQAIDDKSAYTGGHCRRVPEIALKLAQAASDYDSGELADFKLNDESLYEMRIASMLHDCGKITTPIHIVDKATKLERICDRIELVSLRYEILRRDTLIQYLRENSNVTDEMILAAVQKQWDILEDELKFLRTCNIGGEYMAPQKQERVCDIAKSNSWVDAANKEHRLLDENEVYNLNIAKGTLNNEDRAIINYHITATINMLEALPFPRHLKNVAEIAGGHHERMDGKGYPKGLTRDQMSVQARAMGIADIFEALTATDRPYRKAMPLSRVMSIMESMKEEGHIDPELFNIFKKYRIHVEYANEFLEKHQMDIDPNNE